MKWFLALLFVATVFGDLYDDPNYDPLEDCSVTTSKEFCEDFLRRRYGNSRAPPTSATTRSYKEAQLINAKEQKPEPEVNHESCAYLPFPLTDELTCPKGWTLFPETNYCYFAFSANYPYPDAVDVCEKHQATLTVPHSEEENYSIAQLARESIWIGLEFVQDFFHVKTTDGCAVEYTQFNHQRINADCFEAYMTKEGVWNHTGCDDYARLTHSAVCKKVPLVVRREPICPQPPTCKDGSCRLKCRHGWTRFENHCYKALNKQIYHSDQAVEHCIKEGGRLASVQSQEENDFINQLAQNAPKSKGKRALIGGDYNYDYKRFYWIDKCRFEYKNWAPNQPDRHGRKDCLEVPWSWEAGIGSTVAVQLTAMDR
ncbi:hypothetical protein QR680_008177 [Steinernema hermaphroditum]|uniref:C-type lectin domain-containing protein n=1 Tax=Steinernema hermaphroditum TaxID=289476 RepID=A0AA39IFQ6_9BILA|nr:hypothetical protein QR680_008177 [Steinernema hermaphroditum]